MGVSKSVKSELKASGGAPVFGCRAWVNFNGMLATPSIRGSGNVSSVTRNATGDYTINFATALPDANYSFLGTCSSLSGSGANRIVSESPGGSSIRTINALRIGVGVGGNSAMSDVDFVNAAIFR